MKFFKLNPFKSAESMEGNYLPNSVVFNIISRETIQYGGYDCYLINDVFLDLLEDLNVKNIEFQELEVNFSIEHDIEFGKKKNIKNKYRMRRSIVLDEENLEVDYEDDYTQPIVITKKGELRIREDILKLIYNSMYLKKCKAEEIEDDEDIKTAEEEKINPVFSQIKSSEGRSAFLALMISILIIGYIFYIK